MLSCQALGLPSWECKREQDVALVLQELKSLVNRRVSELDREPRRISINFSFILCFCSIVLNN